ncbi:MAG: hypothetical protein AAB438_03700 [Patescibacteria group bacterium]
MDKRTALSSPRILELKKRKRRVLRNRAIFFLILFLIVFIGLIFLSRWDKINLNKIEIEGNKIVEDKMILKVVEDQLSGHYLWFFPKSNVLLYPKNAIRYELTNKFKRLKNVSLEVKDLKTLNIAVSELEGKYTWCGEDVVRNTTTPDDFLNLLEDQCYFLDGNGYIFDIAPYFSGSVYFKFFGKIQNIEDGPIGHYLSPEHFENLTFFRDAVLKIGLKPYAFNIKEDGDIELYLQSSFTPPNAPKIVFKSTSDIVKVVENLQSAVSIEPLKTNLKEKYTNLNYIDLRFGNKIYYKFK